MWETVRTVHVSVLFSSSKFFPDGRLKRGAKQINQKKQSREYERPTEPSPTKARERSERTSRKTWAKPTKKQQAQGEYAERA